MRIRPLSTLSVLCVLACGFAQSGCIPTTSQAAFTEGRQEIRCEGVYEQCKGKVAGCRMDDSVYLSGTFPGSRSVLVETPPGDWKIRVLVFLDPDVQPRYPGSELEVNWYEPGCTDRYDYKLTVDATYDDLFKEAGPDNVLSVEKIVREPGDHLVEIFADATSHFLLRAETANAN